MNDMFFLVSLKYLKTSDSVTSIGCSHLLKPLLQQLLPCHSLKYSTNMSKNSIETYSYVVGFFLLLHNRLWLTHSPCKRKMSGSIPGRGSYLRQVSLH